MIEKQEKEWINAEQQWDRIAKLDSHEPIPFLVRTFCVTFDAILRNSFTHRTNDTTQLQIYIFNLKK